jgi:S1-C subfamily serine protease
MSLRIGFLRHGLAVLLASGVLLPAGVPTASAQLSIAELVSGVVGIKTFINPDARTRENLGRERQGSGMVIDEAGLVLTIGYLMVEAHAAEIVTSAGRTVPADIVGYDHETGFGLLRAIEPLKLKPLAFGKSAAAQKGDPVLVASFGGPAMVGAAHVAAKREFAGEWEYLLEEAIFTAPPHPAWSGAALLNREGKLIGVGSLIVGDTTGDKDGTPGNMFVPIDLLPPILADLLADGRVSGSGRPWVGVTATEVNGRLMVEAVTPGGPADKAGVQRGDFIVGVASEPAKSLAEFYRKVWAQGGAGAAIPLDVQHGAGETRRVDVKSINRLDHLKLKSTF